MDRIINESLDKKFYNYNPSNIEDIEITLKNGEIIFISPSPDNCVFNYYYKNTKDPFTQSGIIRSPGASYLYDLIMDLFDKNHNFECSFGSVRFFLDDVKNMRLIYQSERFKENK